ncbi:MAG: hypothetical protein AAB250_13745 [Bdellovibrionota bacterium]
MSCSSRSFVVLFAFLFGTQAHAHEGEDHGGVPAVVEGDAVVVQADDFAAGKSEIRYFVKDGNGKMRELETPAGMKNPNLITGDKIRVKGHVHKGKPDAILLDEQVQGLGGTTGTATGSTAAAVSGTKTALAIITEFSDATVSGCTDTTVAASLFGPLPTTSVATYFDETSRGTVGITGNVIRVKLPRTMGTTCDSAAYSGWYNDATTEASKSISLAGFTHKIIVLPANLPCSWAGLGTIGGGRTWTKYCSNVRIYAHELGHNFTMHHSAKEGQAEYSDYSDVMGSALVPVNAPHSAQMGWTPATNILEVKSSGTYRITSLEVDSSAAITPQILKVFKEDTNEFLYFSLRSKLGKYGATLGTEYADRLNVHRFGSSAEPFTRLLGTYAGTQTFSSSGIGLTVTPMVLNGTTMDVQVTLSGTCIRRAPTLLVSSMPTVAPGQTGSVNVSVKNNDSYYCSSSTFSTAATISGVTVTRSASSLTIAPGASASYQISIATTTTTPVATYSGSTSVSDASVSGHAASASFGIIVKTPTTKGRGRYK